MNPASTNQLGRDPISRKPSSWRRTGRWGAALVSVAAVFAGAPTAAADPPIGSSGAVVASEAGVIFCIDHPGASSDVTCVVAHRRPDRQVVATSTTFDPQTGPLADATTTTSLHTEDSLFVTGGGAALPGVAFSASLPGVGDLVAVIDGQPPLGSGGISNAGCRYPIQYEFWAPPGQAAHTYPSHADAALDGTSVTGADDPCGLYWVASSSGSWVTAAAR